VIPQAVSARPLDRYPPDLLPVTYGTARLGTGAGSARSGAWAEASDTDHPGREPAYLPW
jgi:hypothetical protein